MKIKNIEIGKISAKVRGIYEDKTIDAMLKLAVLKFMKDLITHKKDITIIVNEIYMKYALKGPTGQAIIHDFKVEYVKEETFKDESKKIIIVPIVTEKDKFAIELEYNTYKSVHKEAINFMDQYVVISDFYLELNEAVKYNISAEDIEYLINQGIVIEGKEGIING